MKRSNSWHYWLALLIFTAPAVAQAIGLNGADTATYNFLWTLVQYVSGLVGIILVGRIIWALQNTEDRGESLKVAIRNLVILGMAWGIGSFILNSAAQNGTVLQGVGGAVQLGH